MQTLMLKLDRMLRRRRWLVLGAWIAIVLAAVPLAARQADHLTGGGYRVDGSEAQAVAADLARRFDGAQHARLAAVLVPAPGATEADARAAVARLDRAATGVAHVRVDPAARRRALRAIDRAGSAQRPVLVPLRVGVGEDDAPDVAIALRDRLGLGHAGADRAPVAVHLAGQSALWAGLQDLTKRDLAKAETAGFPIVALILLAVFGSLAAAALPLVLGAVSVGVTGALIYLISLQAQMSVFVTNMASMIGIGVAVDYSLFVLARYREEVRAGVPPERARAIALATSGVAVTFSGLTVIVSLAGLYLVPTTAIRSMALGAILVVAVSVLAAATLLPVLIALLGHRAYARGRLFTVVPLVVRSWRPRRPGSTSPDRPPRTGFWERWTAAVTRRPVVSAVAAAAVLLALAAPALTLRTGAGALHQLPTGDETRVGFEAAAALTGPGASSPIEVVAPRRLADEVRRTLVRDPAVLRVAAPVPSRDGREALVLATPRRDGESADTKAAIGRLRAALPAPARVGGVSAVQVDFDALVHGSMARIALFVLGLSFVVLLVLLRSVVLPLKAVATNLLSVGAAYGVLTLVFGRVDTITPPLVLAVVFGLSMDYEVFLLTRIRERYAATGNTRAAVAQGLASSARTITSAALIMVGVFAVFVGTGVPSIKQLGLGSAIAVAVDATLVRLVLVPAAMELLGRWNWWLPRPLARVLPEMSLETLATRRA